MEQWNRSVNRADARSKHINDGLSPHVLNDIPGAETHEVQEFREAQG